MIVSLLILLLLVFGCDSYVYLMFLRSYPISERILWWLPTVLLIISTVITFRGNWGWSVQLTIILLMCIFLPKLIFTIFSGIGHIGAIWYHPLSRIFDIIGMVLSAIIFVCSVYGVSFGWKKLQLTTTEIDSPDLPASFNGYTIVQISDLHLGTFGHDSRHIKNLVNMINAQNPDLIVFTGDLVNFTYKELIPFSEELSHLKAKDGVISILGNHDYALYSRIGIDSTQKYLEKLVNMEKDMGWKVLLDENIPVVRENDTIQIIGVQNIGRHFSANRGNLTKAMKGVPEDRFKVLLSHDPTHWEESVRGKTDIQLTLSGHTHAMQLKIFGWSPSSWIFDHWGGHYKENRQHLNVSAGTGGNLPFRFGAWPEVDVLILLNDNSQK